MTRHLPSPNLSIMERKSITPGVYPTMYRCIVCGRDIKKKDLWSTGAQQFNDKLCVCAPCLPQWEEQRNAPMRDLMAEPKPLASLASACSAWWRQRRDRKPRLEATEALTSFLDASRGDPSMRMQLLGIVRLDNLQREALLDPLIAHLHEEHGAPELLQLLHALKQPEIAACARKILDQL